MEVAEVDALCSAINAWRERWKADPPPLLAYQKLSNGVRIIDTRRTTEASVFLTDLLANLLLACVDKPVSIANIRSNLPDACGDYSDDELRAGLGMLADRALVIEEDGRYLALPLPMRLGRSGPALKQHAGVLEAASA